MIAQCSSSKCAQVGNSSGTIQPPSLPQTMQAISYHSHVNPERQLLPANSLLVLYSCDMQQHKQGRCMLHNKPKQPLLPLIRPVHVVL